MQPKMARQRGAGWLFAAVIGVVILAGLGYGALRLLPGLVAKPTAAATQEALAATTGPSAAPTEAAESEQHVRYGWEFNNSYAEGWGDISISGLEPFTFSDGLLKTRTTNNDPWIFSPPDLHIDASKSQIEIRMRISPAQATSACIYFITAADPDYDESKVFCVDYPASDQGIMQTLTFEMSGLDTWRGTVTQMRFDPPELAETDIEIDYIRVISD
jgi:hypothetical protein